MNEGQYVNVLVTGGAGFIGSHLADRLLLEGHDVRVVDDLSTGLRSNVPTGAEFIEGDIADESTAQRALDGIDTVFHQAALGSVPRSVENPRATDHANVHGTVTVLDAAVRAGVRRIVFASSSSIYGGLAPTPISHEAPVRPRSPYAVSKATGESYLKVFCELHGIEALALRYFNVFGPRQRSDSGYAAVIPRWIAELRQGTTPVIYGDGGQTRDFTFVADAVQANIAAAIAPSEICDGRAYNVAGGSEHSLLELYDLVAATVGSTVRPEYQPSRPGDVRHSSADISATTRDIRWTPEVDLATGLQRTI